MCKKMMLFKATCFFVIPKKSIFFRDDEKRTETYILAKDRESARIAATELIKDIEYKYNGYVERLTLLAAEISNKAPSILVIT